MSNVRDLLPISGEGINILPTLVVVLLGFITFLFVKTRRPANFPPGPPVVPLLGSIPFLKHGGAQYYKEFTRLEQKYGGIFSIALGHTWIVVLNRFDVIKEALVTKGTDFAGRITDPREELLYGDNGTLGIIDGDYTPEWSKQRNASLTILRTLGYGKHSIEQQIVDEREALLKIFRDSGSQPFNPAPTIATSVTNIICSMLFGQGFTHGDEIPKRLLSNLDTMVSLLSMDFEWDYVPVLSSCLPGTSYYRKLLGEAALALREYISSEIKTREEKIKNDPDFEASDFIECYLQEVHRVEHEKKMKFSQNWLESIALDFFTAGAETTTTTLKWALIYMQHYPDVQRKVQAELDKVIGKPDGHGLTKLADRKRLMYTEAACMEVQRKSAIVATALVHKTTTNVNIQGYMIPKDTQVRYNVHAVMNDPHYWKDPENFRPERFLDTDGSILKNERWIPFGMGRRNCLGEQLARQELFMFLSAILHNFSVGPPEGFSLPSMEPAMPGVILMPGLYEIVLKPRY